MCLFVHSGFLFYNARYLEGLIKQISDKQSIFGQF
jgi:hypothetical protein